MPLLPFTPSPIELRVSNKALPGGGRLGQRARFWQFGHTQSPDQLAQSTVLIKVIVTAHDLVGEELGDELSAQGFVPRIVELSADNTTLVEAATGAILADLRGLNLVERQAAIDGFAQDTLLQGDFFELLRDTAPVKIGDLLRQHLQQADALGRFA